MSEFPNICLPEDDDFASTVVSFACEISGCVQNIGLNPTAHIFSHFFFYVMLTDDLLFLVEGKHIICIDIVLLPRADQHLFSSHHG